LSISSLRLTAVACLITVAGVVIVNYRQLDQSRNFIARRFAEDIFALAQPHSILLVTGDAFAFPLIYLQKTERAGGDVTLIVLSTLLGEWYARQLRAEHPDLVIPFDRYDRGSKNLKALVEANPGRTIAFAGTVGGDHSLDQDYWPYQQGLLAVIVPKSRNVPLQTILAENERLFSQGHPPAPGTAKMNTFEADIISIYTYPALFLGNQCEQAGLKTEARTWYERALAINPEFSAARDALGRLEH
jgi:hypothetical protein